MTADSFLVSVEILITNDDGIHSPAIRELELALSDLGTLTIVAPDREMSGQSQAITLNRPLRVQKIAENSYAIDGTPADCVMVAMLRIMKERPSLVISGINRGDNVGDDVLYSGTVAAALEAALQGIPAIAVSAAPRGSENFAATARFTAVVARRVLDEGLPEGIILNVNFPEHWNGGVRVTCQGRQTGKTVLIENVDPRGREYYWLHEELHHSHTVAQSGVLTDYQAIEQGFASITPLQLDRTAHHYLKSFSTWTADELSAQTDSSRLSVPHSDEA